MVAVNLWGQLPTNDQILQGSLNRASPSNNSQKDASVKPRAPRNASWMVWAFAVFSGLCVVAAFVQVNSLAVPKLIAGVDSTIAEVQPVTLFKAELRALENKAIAAIPVVAVASQLAQAPPTPDVAAVRALVKSSPPSALRDARSVAPTAGKAATSPPFAAGPPPAAIPAQRDLLPPPSGIAADSALSVKGGGSGLKVTRIDPLSVDSKAAAAISPLVPN